MVDEKKDKEQEGAARKPSLLDNKVVLLGGIVALQLVLAVGLTTLVIAPRLGAGQAAAAGQTDPSARQARQELGVLMSMGEIIVTLRGEGAQSPRYLRIAIDLELTNQAAAQTAAARLPVLRDTAIMTLAERTAADLGRPEGMKGLRDELMRRLSERLPGEILRHIYFSDLVIQ
jgi:flagellar basal body-associated protein FliL